MKLNKYTTLVLSLAAMLFASCSDFLDHVPDERTEIDTEDKVMKLLISAYPDGNPSWAAELNTDNLIDNQAPHMPSSPNDKQILSHYNYGHYADFENYLFKLVPPQNTTYNDYDSPGYLWVTYYSSIATINHALKAIDDMMGENADPSTFSDQLRAAYAEAHLLRAYDHFMLVNLFSKGYRNATDSRKDIGVPYVTEIETIVHKDYDRSNVADVYEKIGKDLEIGLKYMSDVNYKTAPKYHFNTTAAHAFASRYYLYTRQYDKVIDHANQVLTTDSAQTQKMLMSYGIFADCAFASDFATAWQNPNLNNNLMLICTGSLLGRRTFGYRYSMAGLAARDALMIHNSDLWTGYICPAQAIVSGMIFSSSSGDYGFYHTKCGEEFEYSDKIAGIGYPHIIYRAFTANNVLLERAEAEIMLGNYDDACADLMMYWNSGLDSFTDADKKAYVTAGYVKYLTKNNIITPAGARKPAYYSNTSNSNCFENWDFTQTMSADYVVPAEAVPYMNCLNDFRRFENTFEGLRYFDLKRWGMPFEHKVGINSEIITSEALSDNRALEAPWEALSAGLESSLSNGTYHPHKVNLQLNKAALRTNTQSTEE